MKYLFLLPILLCVFHSASGEVQRLDAITDRVVELLQEKAGVEEPTTIEEEIYLLTLSVQFDPVPMAFHRQHVDQIIDFQEGIVVRAYYDYLGSVIRREKKKIDQSRLREYVASLVRVRLDAELKTDLPEIIRVIPSEARRTGEQVRDGNAEKPPGVERES